MKAIIIEDETAAVSSLKAILQQNSMVDIEVIAELESIEDSVTWFRSSGQPDIIFMDIHLADGLAFNIFEQVNIEAPVVFTTAYDEYALQAFQVCSIDYLLKPITLASLEHALNKFMLFNPIEREEHIRRTNATIRNRNDVKKLLIMLADKFYPLPVKDIFYFYTAKEKVIAYTLDGKKHPVDRTLDMLGEQLDNWLFFLCVHEGGGDSYKDEKQVRLVLYPAVCQKCGVSETEVKVEEQFIHIGNPKKIQYVL